MIESRDEFGDVIENVVKALDKVEHARNDARFSHQFSRVNGYNRLAGLSGARSNLYLALGALITAQKSPDSRHVDQQPIALMERWRAVVWDDLMHANDAVAKHDRLEDYESPVPRVESWVGSWPLGSGASGTTHLFVNQNEHGQICNRVVIKNCDNDQNDYQRRLWDRRDTDNNWSWVRDHRGQKIPVEVKTMSDLRGKNGSEFIVKLLNWRISNARRLYRLYLEVWIPLSTVSRIVS